MNPPSHVALSALSIDGVNVRKTGRGAEPIFAGSIRKRGVLQALLVRPNGSGSTFTITDGGKRFDALIWLRDNGGVVGDVPVTDAYPVPVKVMSESDAAARETSFIANIHSEIHPVDRFERFAELVADGATADGIADTYGMKRREVDQALALGDLHPEIRDAWRRGEIKAETAQTYTLARDQKTQAKVFGKLAKSGQLNSRHTVRQELKAEDQEIGHLLNFIGVDAYEARGGKVTARDLFEGKHVVSDTELVATMAAEKLTAECERLVAEGWGWAARAGDLPNRHAWSYQWQRINVKGEPTPEEAARIKQLAAIVNSDDDDVDWQAGDAAQAEHDKIEAAIRLRAFGPKQMAKSGCVVDIDDAGALEVHYGIIKPETAAKVPGAAESEQFEERRKEKAKTAKKTGATAALSNALVHRLSTQLTIAAAGAIKTRPDLALDMTIAAILANGSEFGAGVKLRHSGMGSHKAKGSFKNHYEAVSKLPTPKKLELLADALGMAFDFQCSRADALKAFRATGLCDAFGKEITEATRKAFDAADYFNSASKPLCLAAITEAINADEARKVSGKPKGDIAKFAIANVPKTGWLPPELRTSAYDGPAGAAKTKSAKAPKAKAAAKPKRKAA